jgi:hypothetical protein
MLLDIVHAKFNAATKTFDDDVVDALRANEELKKLVNIRFVVNNNNNNTVLIEKLF